MDFKTFVLVFAWPALSAALNVVLSFKTPEEWELYVSTNPRGASAIKLLRKVGLDLPGLLRLLGPALERASKRGK